MRLLKDMSSGATEMRSKRHEDGPLHSMSVQQHMEIMWPGASSSSDRSFVQGNEISYWVKLSDWARKGDKVNEKESSSGRNSFLITLAV